MQHSIHGLYAIADTAILTPENLVGHVDAALQGGAGIIQYRDKSGNDPQRLQQAGKLAMLCEQHNALLIINDDLELAAKLNAGLHIGRHDAALSQARQQLGADTVIGVSCYNELERAISAQQQGASYVAFGRFFPSQSKPEAVQAEPELIRNARKELTVPIVAIGGINADNAPILINAGADAVAVISDVFANDHPRAAAARYQTLFTLSI